MFLFSSSRSMMTTKLSLVEMMKLSLVELMKLSLVEICAWALVLPVVVESFDGVTIAVGVDSATAN